jgi:hypothetical protein
MKKVDAKYKKGIQRSPSCVLPHTGLKEGGSDVQKYTQQVSFRGILTGAIDANTHNKKEFP